VADAERYRQETVAQGEAEAIREVYTAIHDGNPSEDLIAIKYLEALQVMANGQATKIFLPNDTTGFLGTLAGVAEVLKGAGDAPGSNGGRRR
jgi:regulator of protease activity HflC (stomatin/prohibitin superfamily)